MARSVAVAMASAIEHWPIDRLKPYERNARTHSAEQVAKIAASMIEFGFTNPILVDGNAGIIAGHCRLMAAEILGMTSVPVIQLTHMSDAQKRAYVIADNRLALDAGWDEEVLAHELDDLRDLEFNLSLTGFSDKELADLIGSPDDPYAGEGGEEGKGNLADRFLIPPFSVMNAREGWWQDRKRAWLALGIRSEEGRNIAPTSVSKDVPDYMAGRGNNDGGSIFDPVVCEIAYRWFVPAGGTVLDPFAGGSVRGVVASKIGLQYIGHELRGEQVAANRGQASEICADDKLPPVWIEGDSRNIDKTCADVHADFVFTCPPYADLEVYSEDPKDLSTLAYDDFRAAYFDIIAKACARLKQNRFACCVVGEVRNKKGNYYDFVGDTVQAFRNAGLEFYNEGILVTAVGSLPIRAGRAFSASRKLGKTHQNVLVFLKGDAKKAAAACGEVEVDLPEGMDENAEDQS